MGYPKYTSQKNHDILPRFSMISWRGNTFCITVPLHGEPPFAVWFLLTKCPSCRALMFTLLFAWSSCWTNCLIASDLKRRNANVVLLMYPSIHRLKQRTTLIRHEKTKNTHQAEPNSGPLCIQKKYGWNISQQKFVMLLRLVWCSSL